MQARKDVAVNRLTNKRNNGMLPPREARWLLLAALVINLAVYWGATWLTVGRRHISMALPLDARLPMVTPFILIYVLAYLQWVVSYWLVALDEPGLYRRVLVGDIIAKLATLAIFLLIPTTMQRPAATGGGLFNWLTQRIHDLDAPTRLFPSIHCLESWMACRAGFWMKRLPRWYRWGGLVMTLLVFASTLLVKQHVLVDIPGGILTAELGLGLSGRWLRKKEERKGNVCV